MLRCPVCHQTIPSADASLPDMVAKCVPCDFVFRMEPELVAHRGDEPPPRPDAVEVVHDGAGSLSSPSYRDPHAPHVQPLTLSRRWYDASLLPMVLFCLVWDATVVLAIYHGVASGEWRSLGCLLGHISCGVALSYYTLAGLLNRSHVRLSAGKLEVAHGPLPWPGQLSLPLDAIESVACLPGTQKVDRRRMFDVVANTERGVRKALSNIPHPQADFVAWTLDRALSGRRPPADASSPRAKGRSSAGR